MGALTAADFDLLARVLRREAGICLGEEAFRLAETRLHGLARERGLEDPGAVVERLRTDCPDWRQAVVSALANNETYFFRDPGVFEQLRQQVLPELLQARRSERRLRLWCAACSTGQEAYSLAMLLEDVPELADWEVEILCTDMSERNLTRLRQGAYTQMEVNRGLPARLLVRHFEREEEHWLLNARLRRHMRIQRLNLLEEWPVLAGSCDLLLLRNVMLYWDEPTQQQVLERAARVLARDGWLLVGSTESAGSRFRGAGSACLYRPSS